jgi:AICAR transformylase/IMP cyclohydrolase PurH
VSVCLGSLASAEVGTSSLVVTFDTLSPTTASTVLHNTCGCLLCLLLCRYGENPHQAAAFYVDESLAEAGKVGVG